MQTSAQIAQDVLLEVQRRNQTNMPELKKPEMADYCPICEYPRQDGKCQACADRERNKKEAEVRKRRELSIALGGARAVDQYTVARFKVSDGNKAALEACKTFNPDKENLYLYGPTGRGKTHLAVIAARLAIEKMPKDNYGRIDARLIKPVDIFRSVRAADGASEETDVIMRYATMGVLVLDDVGIGKDTEFAVTTLYEVIDWRYMNAPGGLIITSNLNLGELSTKLGDDRISSRLAQMCKVFNLDKDGDHRLD